MMDMMQWLGDLILSEWIWSITFAFSHYTFLFFIMFFMLLLFTKDSFLRSFFITGLSILFSFGLFFFITTIGLDYLCSWHYCPVFNAPLTLQKVDVIKANYFLATFVIVFQSLFFGLFSLISSYRALPYICVVFISNYIGALCTYGYILITMRHIV